MIAATRNARRLVRNLTKPLRLAVINHQLALSEGNLLALEGAHRDDRNAARREFPPGRADAAAPGYSAGDSMSTDRAFDKWHKAHRHIDRENARSAWDAGAHEGLRRNLRRVGWLHTMHMEFGQTREAMSETNECPWGQRGVNFDGSYRVTSEQIFVLEMK